MILERLNVVKEVATEREAKKLEELGYKRKETVADKEGGTTSGGRTKKSGSKSDKKEDK